MRIRALSLVTVGLSMLAACSGSDAASEEGVKDEVGAAGVLVTRIAIYQGVERDLMVNGAPAQSSVPLIAGRDAMVRVFYATDSKYDGHPVRARLKLGAGAPLEQFTALGRISSQAELASTIDFDVPGARIGDTLSYSVSLLQPGEADHAEAHYPADGLASVPVEGKANTLRMIIVPFRYDTDGSGRLPDTSPEQVERIRQRFLQLYPVSNVEMSVHEPVPWTQAITKDGTGWQGVGVKLFSIRTGEHIPDDTYLYGMFNPNESFAQYCGFGCMLGVTLLNNNPPDVGTVGLRLALGVGYTEYAADTAAHETGHAHGREHANCGPGLDPQSVDQSFPYPKGSIGTWGYDRFARQLVDPSVYSDIMGYCDKKWISDYNYAALHARGQRINLPSVQGPVTEYDLVAVDGAGAVEWGPSVLRDATFAGAPLPVTVRAGAETRTVEAQFFPYDHMPGGWLFVPRTSAAPSAVSLTVDGMRVEAAR